MASNVFNNALKRLVDGTIDLDTHDIRCALLMTNTTADTEKDAINFISNIGTLDECNATGYARVALTSEAVNTDDANDRAEFDAADVSFTGLSGDASRAIQGASFTNTSRTTLTPSPSPSSTFLPTSQPPRLKSIYHGIQRGLSNFLSNKSISIAVISM